MHSCLLLNYNGYWCFILPFYLLLGYYLQNDTLDIKFIMLRKTFVILRVSGWSANGMYQVWIHLLFLFSFQYHLRLGSSAVLTLIVFTLHSFPFCLVSILLLCIIFWWCLSRIMFRYCSKFEHSLTPNIFHQFFTVNNSKKTGIYDLSGFPKQMELKWHFSFITIFQLIIHFNQMKYASDFY